MTDTQTQDLILTTDGRTLKPLPLGGYVDTKTGELVTIEGGLIPPPDTLDLVEKAGEEFTEADAERIMLQIRESEILANGCKQMAQLYKKDMDRRAAEHKARSSYLQWKHREQLEAFTARSLSKGKQSLTVGGGTLIFSKERRSIGLKDGQDIDAEGALLALHDELEERADRGDITAEEAGLLGTVREACNEAVRHTTEFLISKVPKSLLERLLTDYPGVFEERGGGDPVFKVQHGVKEVKIGPVVDEDTIQIAGPANQKQLGKVTMLQASLLVKQQEEESTVWEEAE